MAPKWSKPSKVYATPLYMFPGCFLKVKKSKGGVPALITVDCGTSRSLISGKIYRLLKKQKDFKFDDDPNIQKHFGGIAGGQDSIAYIAKLRLYYEAGYWLELHNVYVLETIRQLDALLGVSDLAANNGIIYCYGREVHFAPRHLKGRDIHIRLEKDVKSGMAKVTEMQSFICIEDDELKVVNEDLQQGNGQLMAETNGLQVTIAKQNSDIEALKQTSASELDAYTALKKAHEQLQVGYSQLQAQCKLLEEQLASEKASRDQMEAAYVQKIATLQMDNDSVTDSGQQLRDRNAFLESMLAAKGNAPKKLEESLASDRKDDDESPKRHQSSRRRSRRSRSPSGRGRGGGGGGGRRPNGGGGGGAGEEPEPSRCLGIFGMNQCTGERELKGFFGQYGSIERVQIIYDRQTGQSRGFGFVYFENVDDAVGAKERAAGVELSGHVVRIDFSLTKRAHSPKPGVYMGRPQNRRSGSYGGDRDGSGYRNGGGGGGGYRDGGGYRGGRGGDYNDRGYGGGDDRRRHRSRSNERDYR